MGMLKFFDTSELEQFATTLADDLTRRFPPASEARTDPGAQHQIKVILEGLAARAVRYHQQQKFGVYKKAKLGQRLQVAADGGGLQQGIRRTGHEGNRDQPGGQVAGVSLPEPVAAAICDGIVHPWINRGRHEGAAHLRHSSSPRKRGPSVARGESLGSRFRGNDGMFGPASR